MIRSILGVVAGYVATALLIFVVFTSAYKVLGAEGSFRPGSWEVSGAWAAMGLVTGLAAAFVGGLVCMAISRTPKAVAALAILILALGVLNAALELRKPAERPSVRAEAPTSQEAMLHARQPLWMMLLNPLIGLAGVLAGGRVLRRKD